METSKSPLIYKSEITSLMDVIPALRKSGLTLLAGRPAQGKSAFMLSMAKVAAMDRDIPTAIFSLEMDTKQCLMRLIGLTLSIDSRDIKKGKTELREEEIPENILKAPLYIDDTPCLSINTFKSLASSLVHEKGVQLIFIDYVWLMTASDNYDEFSSWEEELYAILQSLKSTAQELNVPIIAIAQLCRTLRRQDKKTPDIEDLQCISKWAVSIPDAICFIHRPQYYTPDKTYKNTTSEIAELILAKNPDGEEGTTELLFTPPNTTGLRI